MKWIKEKYKKVSKLPFPLMFSLIFSKFLFGLGLGLILAGYFKFDWKLIGWIAITLSFVVSIPATFKIYSK